MLPKKLRLVGERNFKRIYTKGKSFSGQLCCLRTMKTSPPDKIFAIVIGKKVVKKATERNRYKRQIGEVIFSLLPQLKPGHKSIIILRKKPKNFQELRKDLEKCLKKAVLL